MTARVLASRSLDAGKSGFFTTPLLGTSLTTDVTLGRLSKGTASDAVAGRFGACVGEVVFFGGIEEASAGTPEQTEPLNNNSQSGTDASSAMQLDKRWACQTGHARHARDVRESDTRDNDNRTDKPLRRKTDTQYNKQSTNQRQTCHPEKWPTSPTTANHYDWHKRYKTQIRNTRRNARKTRGTRARQGGTCPRQGGVRARQGGTCAARQGARAQDKDELVRHVGQRRRVQLNTQCMTCTDRIAC